MEALGEQQPARRIARGERDRCRTGVVELRPSIRRRQRGCERSRQPGAQPDQHCTDAIPGLTARTETRGRRGVACWARAHPLRASTSDRVRAPRLRDRDACDHGSARCGPGQENCAEQPGDRMHPNLLSRATSTSARTAAAERPRYSSGSGAAGIRSRLARRRCEPHDEFERFFDLDFVFASTHGEPLPWPDAQRRRCPRGVAPLRAGLRTGAAHLGAARLVRDSGCPADVIARGDRVGGALTAASAARLRNLWLLETRCCTCACRAPPRDFGRPTTRPPRSTDPRTASACTTLGRSGDAPGDRPAIADGSRRGGSPRCSAARARFPP